MWSVWTWAQGREPLDCSCFSCYLFSPQQFVFPLLCHFILLHSTNEIWQECHQSLLPLSYLVSIFAFPAYSFLSSGPCQGMCRSISICLQDAGEASRAHHLLGSSTSSGPFLLYSEPSRNLSHTSALWEDELNKSLLGRVTFRLQGQSFGKWCGTKRVVRASDSSSFLCWTLD